MSDYELAKEAYDFLDKHGVTAIEGGEGGPNPNVAIYSILKSMRMLHAEY